MDRARLTRLLEEPARVAREDLSGLKDITERYPWFSGAHLLLAMGEHASGEVLFEETLRTTAAHLPSRAVLFDQVHDAQGKLDPGAREVRTTIAVPAPPSPTSGQRPAEIVLSRDDLAERILQQQILEAAATGAYHLEAEVQRLEATTDETGLAEASVPVSEEPTPVHPPSTNEMREDDLSPRSFTAWLDAAPIDQEPGKPFEKVGAISGGAMDLNRGSSGATPMPEARPTATPVLTKDLIDRFLERSTPEAPRKVEFFTPQQAGKRSLEEHLDIVTETLARIHEKQGHWAKAVAVYRRLALKHPEKSGYFAALAKKAEQNLNA